MNVTAIVEGYLNLSNEFLKFIEWCRRTSKRQTTKLAKINGYEWYTWHIGYELAVGCCV